MSTSDPNTTISGELLADYLAFGNQAATALTSRRGTDDANGNAVRASITVVALLSELRDTDPERADQLVNWIHELLDDEQATYDTLHAWTLDALDEKPLDRPARADAPPQEHTTPAAAEPRHPWNTPTAQPVTTVAAAAPPQPDPNQPDHDHVPPDVSAFLARVDDTSAKLWWGRLRDPQDLFNADDVRAIAKHWDGDQQ